MINSAELKEESTSVQVNHIYLFIYYSSLKTAVLLTFRLAVSFHISFTTSGFCLRMCVEWRAVRVYFHQNFAREKFMIIIGSIRYDFTIFVARNVPGFSGD